jgi:hypothetical protein
MAPKGAFLLSGILQGKSIPCVSRFIHRNKHRGGSIPFGAKCDATAF